MDDTTDTLKPRPPLWRIILDSLKSMSVIGLGIAVCVAATAGIFWYAPYVWALWVAIAQGITLGGNPWAVIGASIVSPFLLFLGISVTLKVTSDCYQGKPSRMDWSVIAGILAASAISLVIAFTAATTTAAYYAVNPTTLITTTNYMLTLVVVIDVIAAISWAGKFVIGRENENGETS